MSTDSSDLDSPIDVLPSRPVDKSFYPGAAKSLSGIAERAFILGGVFGFCVLASVQLLLSSSTYWRAALLLGALALFHFLEFLATALYNPNRARVSAFLLASNGWSYNIAHACSFGEFFVRRWMTSQCCWPECFTLSEKLLQYRHDVHTYYPYAATMGICLMIIGQFARTAAMAEAGTSFNHLVQYKKHDDHTLITTGVYQRCRHPAYFGFFWYVVGAQLMMGNTVCLVLLPTVTWQFFATRIPSELPKLAGLERITSGLIIYRRRAVSYRILRSRIYKVQTQYTDPGSLP